MMMMMIILTASYIGDDMHWVYTMQYISVTDERTDKAILGLGLYFIISAVFVSIKEDQHNIAPLSCKLLWSYSSFTVFCIYERPVPSKVNPALTVVLSSNVHLQFFSHISAFHNNSIVWRIRVRAACQFEFSRICQTERLTECIFFFICAMWCFILYVPVYVVDVKLNRKNWDGLMSAQELI